MRSFDFQVHSKYSYDSWNSFRNIKKQALRNGIDGIAITDHETIKGGLESKKYSDDNFLFITGQEISTNLGDIIGLMLSDNVNSSDFFEVIDEIKAQNGITYLPHPSRKMNLTIDEIKSNIDLVEAVNGRSTPNENRYSMKLALDLELPYASGSDAHVIREIGKVKTVFSEEVSSEEELRKCLLDLSNKRKIIGLGSYNIINHFQSSLIGTMETGQIKEFAKGIVKKIKK